MSFESYFNQSVVNINCITIFNLLSGLNSKKLDFLSSTVLVLKHAVVNANVAEALEPCTVC